METAASPGDSTLSLRRLAGPVVVTGGSSGLGRAVVDAVALAGAMARGELQARAGHAGDVAGQRRRRNVFPLTRPEGCEICELVVTPPVEPSSP